MKKWLKKLDWVNRSTLADVLTTRALELNLLVNDRSSRLVLRNQSKGFLPVPAASELEFDSISSAP